MRKKRILFVQPPYIAGAMISLKEQIVQYYVMIMDLLLLIGKVLRSSKPYKIRKVKVIIKGLWKGIWFSPQIEFAE